MRNKLLLVASATSILLSNSLYASYTHNGVTHNTMEDAVNAVHNANKQTPEDESIRSNASQNGSGQIEHTIGTRTFSHFKHGFNIKPEITSQAQGKAYMDSIDPQCTDKTLINTNYTPTIDSIAYRIDQYAIAANTDGSISCGTEKIGFYTMGFSFHYTVKNSKITEPRDPNESQENSCAASGGKNTFGNPCDIVSGNKMESYIDYQNKYLKFSRHYKSQNELLSNGTFGKGWSHSYSDYLRTFDSKFLSVEYVSDEGAIHVLNGYGGSLKSKNEVGLSAKLTVDNFIIKDKETYKYFNIETGLLEKVKNGSHFVYIERNSNSKITRIYNDFGSEILINYSQSSDFIESITLPDLKTISYIQDSNLNLDKVIFQDLTEIDYLYENKSFLNHLTGYIDQNNIRYATWAYDSQGRGISSQHAGGFELASISLDRKVLTNSKGHTTTFKYTDHFTTKKRKIYRATKSSGGGAYKYVGFNQYAQNDAPTQIRAENGLITDLTLNTNNVLTKQVQRDSTGTYKTTNLTQSSSKIAGYEISKYDFDNYSVSLMRDDFMNVTMKTITDKTNHSTPYSTNGRTRVFNYVFDYKNHLRVIDNSRTGVNDYTFLDYDDFGNLVSVKNALCYDLTQPSDYLTLQGIPLLGEEDSSVSYSNYASNPLVKNANCMEITYSGFNAHHQATVMIDQNGIETNYVFDLMNRIDKVIVKYSTGDQITDYDYDGVGNLDKVTFPDGSFLDYDYNDARYLVKITNNLGEYIEKDYDTEGMETFNRIKLSDGTLVKQYQKVWSNNNNLEEYISGEGFSTTYSYDVMNKLASTTDHLNNVTTFERDGLGRIIKQIDATNGEVLTSYDKSDNVASVTDQRGNTTYYTVDGFNQVIRTNSPDTGIEDYWFDDAGNNTQTVNAKTTVNKTFDVLNRVLTKTYNDSTLDEVYSYDNGVFAKGRMTGVTYKHGSINYIFNEYGQVDVKTEIINAVPYITDYDYDNLGRLDSITYPSGTIVSYVRDTLGRISGINYQFDSNDTVKSLVSNIQYLPFGGVKSYTLGNGVTYTGSFDLDYQVTNVTYNNGISHIFNETYGYEMLNQLNTITDNLNNLNNQNFVFNAKKELIQAVGAYGQIDYDYDAVGNRAQKITNLVNIEDYIIDPNSNRLTAVNADTLSQTFTYDGVGNMIEDNGFDSVVDTLTYGDNNRLTAFNSISYGYNPFGQRVIENGKINQYSGSDLIYVEDGTKTVEYIYLGSVKMAMIEKDGSTDNIYYAVNNYMGLPRAFTNDFGIIVWSGQFKPFGEIYDENGQVSNFIRFIGQYDNVESEYFYNYFRDYAPALGRYIQSDPIGLNAGVNTYTYVLNNPVNYVDPLGLDVSVTIKSNGDPSSRPIGSVDKVWDASGDHVWIEVQLPSGDSFNVSTYPGGGDVNSVSVNHPEDAKKNAIASKTFTYPDSMLNEVYDAIGSCGIPKWTYVTNCSTFGSCVINKLEGKKVFGRKDPFTFGTASTPKMITTEIIVDTLLND